MDRDEVLKYLRGLDETLWNNYELFPRLAGRFSDYPIGLLFDAVCEVRRENIIAVTGNVMNYDSLKQTFIDALNKR